MMCIKQDMEFFAYQNVLEQKTQLWVGLRNKILVPPSFVAFKVDAVLSQPTEG